jgi:adenine-specific DNA-methyltransferase
MDKESVKKRIQELVDKYEAVKKDGKLKTYSEEDTIQGFILPLFEILGWNIRDKNEVSSQDHIKGSGRPDHTLKINGITQFYLESKKLSVNLDDETFAKQVINYSWNTGVTYAVLTDFDGIKVFNAQRIDKTDLMDKLVFELSHDKYISDFETLWFLSKESFQKKALDEYAEKIGKKEKSVQVATVIKKINEDIQDCREWLNKEFKSWNENLNLSKDVIDEGVQKLLDRLIFLRVAEDREVEPNILKNLLREAEKSKGYEPFKAMSSIFRDLDKIYNSNLFSPHPFESWTIVDNPGFEKMINSLYGKKGQYEYNFKEMPADVLGTVYENYLNYKLTQSKKGINVEKDVKKRKEQGIFYTPTFVVDYIVKNTLKPVLDNCKSIADLKKIKVLDPACGSGSFLIRALEAIEEKYKEFGVDGSVKRQIILENLFGVDLDMQAVEIARLNLLINSLDSKEILPKLNNNIKNGNSLTFNWKEEFSGVFKQGGFDVIIGNPPYIKEFVNKEAFDGLHDSRYYQGKMDLWTMFACISIDLLKDGGVMGFIAPNNWVTNAGASIMRNKILTDGELKTFIDFGDYKVFQAAGIQTMIYIYEKQKPSKKYEIDYLRIDDKNISEEKLVLDIFGEKQRIEIEPEKLVDKNITFSNQESGSIFDKIEKRKNFELAEKEVGQGIVAAPDKYFLESNVDSYTKDEKFFLKPFFTASGKYKGGESDGSIFYISDKNFGDKKLEDYPNIENHFKPFEKILKEAKERYGTPQKPYFYLHREREETFFDQGPKIVCGVRVAYPSFFYTEEPYYGSRALNFIKTDRINLKYLTGILNSKLSFFWLKNKGKQLGDLLQVDKGPLMEIPICVGDKEQQKEIIDLVDKMISLNKEFHEVLKNSNEWESIKSEIEKTDKKINEEVYKLYGLNEEEIKIVEEN